MFSFAIEQSIRFRIGWAILALLLVNGNSAQCAPKTGRIYLVNEIDKPFTILNLVYIDSEGDEKRLEGSWTVAPGKTVEVTVRGKSLDAQSFTCDKLMFSTVISGYMKAPDDKGRLWYLTDATNAATFIMRTSRTPMYGFPGPLLIPRTLYANNRVVIDRILRDRTNNDEFRLHKIRALIMLDGTIKDPQFKKSTIKKMLDSIEETDGDSDFYDPIIKQFGLTFDGPRESKVVDDQVFMRELLMPFAYGLIKRDYPELYSKLVRNRLLSDETRDSIVFWANMTPERMKEIGETLDAIDQFADRINEMEKKEKTKRKPVEKEDAFEKLLNGFDKTVNVIGKAADAYEKIDKAFGGGLSRSESNSKSTTISPSSGAYIQTYSVTEKTRVRFEQEYRYFEIKGTVKFRKTGTYVVKGGYVKNGKFQKGGVSGTEYFTSKSVTGDAGDQTDVILELHTSPVWNDTFDVVVE